MDNFDVAVIGAGAAGMMAAGIAGQRGKKVVLIEHQAQCGEKIRISGGGRCNFTNRTITPSNYVSNNPKFCRAAFKAYSSQDFIHLVQSYRIPFHEKHLGQLFCDHKSQDIIDLLQAECRKGNVTWRMPCSVEQIEYNQQRFMLHTTSGLIQANKLVIATGGLPVEKIGATDFGLRVAKQFGLEVIAPSPALVPFSITSQQWQAFIALAGIALPVQIKTQGVYGKAQFLEDMLFTHRGLSGPAILQISNYWQPSQSLQINLLPSEKNVFLRSLKQDSAHQRKQLNTILNQYLPRQLTDIWLGQSDFATLINTPLIEIADKKLQLLGETLQSWQVTPSNTEGYKKAEVMRGGIDTDELDQQSMQAKKIPGLYFIGETVDVTGWLGGYNFQWAWTSAFVCANHV